MTITVRRWSFLIVLVVVVVLGLPAGKQSTTKDDDDHGKTREFPARPRGRRRTRSAGGEAIDDEGRRR
jgi:hypothetical protein